MEHPLINSPNYFQLIEVAVEVFSNQDKAMTLNGCKLNRIDSIATGMWAAYYCGQLWVRHMFCGRDL